MRKEFSLLVFLWPWAVMSQVYPYFPPPGLSYNSIDHTLTSNQPVGLLKPGFSINGDSTGIPSYEIIDNSSPVDTKRWWWLASSIGLTGITEICAISDSGTPGQCGLQLNRVGTNTTQAAILAGTKNLAIKSTGDLLVNGSVGTSGQPIISAGTGADATFAPLDLSNTSAVTNALTVPNGGTAAATLTNHGVLIGQGTSAITGITALASDTLLQGQGASADPASVALVNCGDGTHALAYSTTSHTFSCQTITGSGGASFLTAAKSSDTSRASTTTVTDDPSLQFTSQAAGTYSIEWTIIATGPTSLANLKFGINCTGTVTTAFWATTAIDQTGVRGGNAGQNACNASTTTQTVTLSIVAGNYEVIQGFGTAVTSTSGTISIQWAQGTSNVTAVVLKQGSWMRISKIL